MEKSKDRLEVINNIKKAVESNELNSKVELGDPFVTKEDREKVILNYDTMSKMIKAMTKSAQILISTEKRWLVRIAERQSVSCSF